MENTTTKPDIRDSAFEHIIQFDSPWIDKWTIPNPFMSSLYELLKAYGTTLADFGFKQDAKNVAETALVITIQRLRTTIKVGIDSLSFTTLNPDWDMAPQLVELFDSTVESIRATVGKLVKTQNATIVFHVTAGDNKFGKITSKLINTKLVGDGEFYGISVTREDSSLFFEPSAKYDGGVFFRLTRKFDGFTKFADIALALYNDEVSALKLLEVEGLV